MLHYSPPKTFVSSQNNNLINQQVKYTTMDLNIFLTSINNINNP